MITYMTHMTEPLPQFNFSGVTRKMHCTDDGETVDVPDFTGPAAKAFIARHNHGVKS